MKRIRKFLYAGIVVVVVFGVGYYFLGNGATEAVETVSGQVQRVVDVTRGDLNLIVSANGVVQPINKVDIRSKASGQILELRFEEGQSAKKGDLLIALDQTTTKNDYEQAKADLALAEAAFQQSSNNHTRYKELFEKNLVSQQELDQTQTDYVRTQSQLVKAKAALSSADERLRDTRILAPIDGVILSKAVDVGQIIASAVSNVGGEHFWQRLRTWNKFMSKRTLMKWTLVKCEWDNLQRLLRMRFQTRVSRAKWFVSPRSGQRSKT